MNHESDTATLAFKRGEIFFSVLTMVGVIILVAKAIFSFHINLVLPIFYMLATLNFMGAYGREKERAFVLHEQLSLNKKQKNE